MNHRPLLLMFLGVTGSGKSFFARQLAQKTGAVRFNGDAMRLAMFKTPEAVRAHYKDPAANPMTFGAIDYAASQVLLSGHDVIYDANSNSRAVREGQRHLAEKYGALPLVVQLKIPLELAKKRALEREETADQPVNPGMIDEIIERNLANFDELRPNEKIISIDGKIPFKEQFASYNRQLKEILSDDSQRNNTGVVTTVD